MGQSFQILQLPVERHLVVDSCRLLVRFNFWRTQSTVWVVAVSPVGVN